MQANDIVQWKARVGDEARATLALLTARLKGLEKKLREEAREFLTGAQPALLERIEATVFDPAGALKLRYHGDYHLGQVLLRENDFFIIDFEGEPARTLEERREKHSPLRDVAGMLRSFDYARWSALQRAAAGANDAACASLAEEWLKATRAAFLGGYAKSVEGSGLLASFQSARELVGLFEIEKALYELRYELNNRPRWAAIPLHGLRAFVLQT